MCDWDSDSEYSSSDSECGWNREGYDMFSYAGKFLGDLIWGSSEGCCDRGGGRVGSSYQSRDCERRKAGTNSRSACKKSGGSCERNSRGCNKRSGGSAGGVCGCSGGGSCRGSGGGGFCSRSGGVSCSRSSGRSPGAPRCAGGSCSRKPRDALPARSPGSKPAKLAPSRNKCCYK